MDTEADTEADTENEDVKPPVATPNKLELNASAKGISLIGGRTFATDSGIYCDQAGSGIEFNLFNTGKTITFSVGTSASCYFKAFVNDVPVMAPNGSELHYISGKGMIIVSGLIAGQQTVRLVKIYNISRESKRAG